MYKDIDVYNPKGFSWTMIFLYKRLFIAVIVVALVESSVI